MACNHAAAAKDDVVADDHVVADMRVRRQKIMRADDGVFRQLVGAMHRHVFAKNIVVANAQAGRLALVFHILRRVADDAARVKLVAPANLGHAHQINVRPDDAVGAQLHARLDHGVRADADVRAQLRRRMDDCTWMNHFRDRFPQNRAVEN